MGKVQWASILPYLWSISACWGQKKLWIVQKDWLNRSEFNWNLEHFPNNYLKKEKRRWWLSKSIFHQKKNLLSIWKLRFCFILDCGFKEGLSSIKDSLSHLLEDLKHQISSLLPVDLEPEFAAQLDVFFFSCPHLIWLVVSNIDSFHPYWGRWSNLTNIFQMGWNQQLVARDVFFLHQKNNQKFWNSLKNVAICIKKLCHSLKSYFFF